MGINTLVDAVGEDEFMLLDPTGQMTCGIGETTIHSSGLNISLTSWHEGDRAMSNPLQSLQDAMTG